MNTAIIIGGGVIGLSTAYHLALRNFGRIILLEKGVVGDGSSSRAAGGITGLLWTDTGVAARKISLARFRELSDELDGYRFQIRNGCVVGVKTAAGNLEAEAVIVTVHVWALRVLESLGLRLPLKFFVHQRWVTKPLALPLRIPLVNANPWLGYVRPAYDGRALVGFETADREEFRVTSADYQMTGLTAPAGLLATLRDHFSGLTPLLRHC